MLRSGSSCIHDGDDNKDDRTDHFTPCTCTRGNNLELEALYVIQIIYAVCIRISLVTKSVPERLNPDKASSII